VVLAGERRSHLGEVGAGIVLWPNAMHVLHRWGLADPVLAAGHVPTSGAPRTWRGRIITTPRPPEQLGHRFGMPMVVLHRAR
jgi:salicylate hydroxylase